MRQEVYRVAYDEAKAELGEILAKFEALRVRKDRIEAVVDALKPLMVAEAPTAGPDRLTTSERPAAPTEHAPSLVQENVQQAPEPAQPAQQVAEETLDPFQRRVENAIGLGSGAKDIREYSRLFNGGSSR
ncbi:MAG TPA: hypothetical protein VMU48_17695 [Terracidiphilus sp.]|nr:hypothetical protein [Terracidiphilus sp.]